MPARRPRILILNAALAGGAGNTAMALERVRRLLAKRASIVSVTLADGPERERVLDELARADAFVFGSGTHWDSWSSLLQKFLEAATPTEGTKVWLGKPAACVITEHSAGGKGVLSRLQGVLVTLGCAVPPMSGLVLSRAALLAARTDEVAARDFWNTEDLGVVCHNLIEAANGTKCWRVWPVDRTEFGARWMGEVGS